MKFNLQAATFEERYRTAVVPRLMLWPWFKYQAKRSKIAYLPAYRRSRNRKPPWRIVLEVTALLLRWRCLPFHYLRYGLYEKDHGLRDVLGYLPETVFYYRLLSRLNRDTLLLDDKVVCKRVLGDGRIAQAHLLLSGDRQTCLDSIGKSVVDGELGNVLSDGQAVVIKPTRYSSGGDGVMVLTHKGGSLYDRFAERLSLSAYGSTWGPWLVEQFVTQHQDLAALSRQSLNTFRVITTWHSARGARAEYCILKLGLGAGPVDNAHDGGLYVGVDKETGRLADTAFDERFVRYYSHPVSNVTFAGRQIAAVRDVVALAERSASLFPQTVLIGWDIAIGEDGPLVIEGNSSPGLTNVQRTHGGVARTLGRNLAHEYGDWRHW